MKAIKDVMRNLPSSCLKDDTLKVVAERMAASNTEFLPVTDKNMEVIGTITYKEISALLIKNENCNLLVSDVMNTGAQIINTYDDEASALQIMRSSHSMALPVVDEKNHLKGVVSFVTLARRIIQLKQELNRNSESRKVQGLGLSAYKFS